VRIVFNVQNVYVVHAWGGVGWCGSHFVPISGLLQRKVKRGAFALPGLGPDAAAVAGNDAVTDGQTNARAGDALRRMQAFEHPEQLAGVGGVEPDPVVAYVIYLFVANCALPDFDARFRFGG
jgi:hypothetical protein